MKKTLISLLAATMLLTGSTTLLSASQGKNQTKPFLIQGKLPHLTMLVKILWDDEDLALTPKQQEELILIRQHTMASVNTLKVKIIKLEAQVVKASADGKKPTDMKKMVNEIAALRAKATMTHLECIYNTRAVLSADQLSIVE